MAVYRPNEGIGCIDEGGDRTVKNLIRFWVISMIVLPAIAFGADCALKDSVYEDADGKGFQLEFGPASGASASVTHTAVLKHSKRGTVIELNFTVGPGSAQAFLSPRAEREGGKAHRIHFFGIDLRSADWVERAPEYLFVEGLGPEGYSSHRGKGGRDAVLGNPMWKLVRCRDFSMDQKVLPLQSTKPAEEQLSSAEWMTDDGRIAAYGYIRSLGVKDGKRFLKIDYVEWLSESECRRRVRAGALKWAEDECETEVRIMNENPHVRRFAVSTGVEITCQYPDQPVKLLSWEKFTGMWRTRAKETRELRDGLWKIERRDSVVERIEWVWLP